MLDLCIHFIDLFLEFYLCFCISFISAAFAFHTFEYFRVFEASFPRQLVIYDEVKTKVQTLENSPEISPLVRDLFIAKNNTDLALEHLKSLEADSHIVRIPVPHPQTISPSLHC